MIQLYFIILQCALLTKIDNGMCLYNKYFFISQIYIFIFLLLHGALYTCRGHSNFKYTIAGTRIEMRWNREIPRTLILYVIKRTSIPPWKRNLFSYHIWLWCLRWVNTFPLYWFVIVLWGKIHRGLKWLKYVSLLLLNKFIKSIPSGSSNKHTLLIKEIGGMGQVLTFLPRGTKQLMVNMQSGCQMAQMSNWWSSHDAIHISSHVRMTEKQLQFLRIN